MRSLKNHPPSGCASTPASISFAPLTVYISTFVRIFCFYPPVLSVIPASSTTLLVLPTFYRNTLLAWHLCRTNLPPTIGFEFRTCPEFLGPSLQARNLVDVSDIFNFFCSSLRRWWGGIVCFLFSRAWLLIHCCRYHKKSEGYLRRAKTAPLPEEKLTHCINILAWIVFSNIDMNAVLLS